MPQRTATSMPRRLQLTLVLWAILLGIGFAPARGVGQESSGTITYAETTSPPFCVGDCDGLNGVTVNEIIILVNIALGSADNSACPHGISAGATVDVSLIIQAVNNALNGCPSSPVAGNWVFHDLYVTHACGGSGYSTGTGVLDTSGCGDFTITGLDNEGGTIGRVDRVCAALDPQGKVTVIDTARGVTVFDNGALTADKNMIVGNGIDTTNGARDVGIVAVTRRASQYVVADLAGSWSFHDLYVTPSGGGSGYSTATVTLDTSGNGTGSGTGLDNEGNSETFSRMISAALDPQGRVTLIDTTKGRTIFDNGALNADKNMIVGTSLGGGDVTVDVLTRTASQYALVDLVGSWVFHNLYVTRACGGSGYGTAMGVLDTSGCGDFTITGSDNEGGTIGRVDRVCATLDPQGKVTVIDTTRGVTVFDNGALSADKNMIVGNGIDTTNGARDVGIVVITRSALASP